MKAFSLFALLFAAFLIAPDAEARYGQNIYLEVDRHAEHLPLKRMFLLFDVFALFCHFFFHRSDLLLVLQYCFLSLLCSHLDMSLVLSLLTVRSGFRHE